MTDSQIAQDLEQKAQSAEEAGVYARGASSLLAVVGSIVGSALGGAAMPVLFGVAAVGAVVGGVVTAQQKSTARKLRHQLANLSASSSNELHAATE